MDRSNLARIALITNVMGSWIRDVAYESRRWLSDRIFEAFSSTSGPSARRDVSTDGVGFEGGFTNERGSTLWSRELSGAQQCSFLRGLAPVGVAAVMIAAVGLSGCASTRPAEGPSASPPVATQQQELPT